MSGGPAGARNSGLAEVDTEFVAFLDSDCIPPRDWLHRLLGHLDDPLVGAVAPRVRPQPPGSSDRLVHRYLLARSPIDMGPDAKAVQPGGPVPYVPTAALLVRRRALDGGLDEGLRYGEDVDLIWRLHDAGWRIRYDPSVTVAHEEPATLRRALLRRFRYGTSAAALARRHPGRLAPLVVRPWPALTAVLLLAGRPRAATVIATQQSTLLAQRLSRIGVRRRNGPRWFAEATIHTALSLSRYAATYGLPLTLALAWRARSRSAFILLVLPALLELRRRDCDLDPLRWTALVLSDDAAYGAGVYWGALSRANVHPLIPALRPGGPARV